MFYVLVLHRTLKLLHTGGRDGFMALISLPILELGSKVVTSSQNSRSPSDSTSGTPTQKSSQDKRCFVLGKEA